jgi:hypothetical protein
MKKKTMMNRYKHNEQKESVSERSRNKRWLKMIAMNLEECTISFLLVVFKLTDFEVGFCIVIRFLRFGIEKRK